MLRKRELLIKNKKLLLKEINNYYLNNKKKVEKINFLKASRKIKD